ncbi:hypothetical protein ACEWA7_20065 [Vibrio parahaemolyticus]
MDKLEQLGQQLEAVMKHVDRGATGDIKNHKVNPLALELAKNKNPYLTLLKESHERFECEYGYPPQLVKMPLAMLLSLLSDLPHLEQQLFWISTTKKIEGMEVKLSQDGTLRLF